MTGHRDLLARVNPVTRLVLATLVSLPLLFTLDWLSASVALAGEVLLAGVCGVRWREVWRPGVPIAVAAALGAVSTALYGKSGGHVYWHWGLATVSSQSIHLAIAIGIRVLALGLPAIVLFRGVDATGMADGLSQVFHLPARLVLGSLAGFRMLAVFTDDWRSIGRARRARGLGDAGRLRRGMSMAFGLLVVAIRRGTRLATAMEARGLGAPGVRRTWARPSVLTAADAVAVVAVCLLMALALGAAVAAGTFWPVWS